MTLRLPWSPLTTRRIPFSASGAVFFVLLIGLAQHLTPHHRVHWHYILQRIYYIPVAGAGLLLGWRAGLVTAILAGICFAVMGSGVPGSSDPLDRMLESLIFLLVGILTGALSDRERERRRELEEAKTRLEEVHLELKHNFESMKRADRLSAIGHLSAGLAHEIRNPLASIEGAVAIVKHEPENATRRGEFLDIIQIECRRLNNLLTHFLDFARPRKPDLGLTDLGAILESVSSLASHAVRDDRTRIRIEMPPDFPLVECDREQMKQVLLNLVLNSVQSMPKGGEVVMSAARENDAVVIRVKDQGAGIPAEHVDHVFDPFFTLKETGTGLGLPVAHGIVTQHGGELQVESTGPRGTVFAVTLPWRQQTSS
ncbi:MAG TPA: ATP-binding protein [Bryobacteraceae bacterium]|nr:ATP-binding protein [Bryobacteraceae bacterium]